MVPGHAIPMRFTVSACTVSRFASAPGCSVIAVCQSTARMTGGVIPTLLGPENGFQIPPPAIAS